MTDDQIHWFSIINSLMIVLFLSGMVAMIMMRTLHRDISNYNQLETVEEAQEETGWKLVSIGAPLTKHISNSGCAATACQKMAVCLVLALHCAALIMRKATCRPLHARHWCYSLAILHCTDCLLG